MNALVRVLAAAAVTIFSQASYAQDTGAANVYGRSADHPKNAQYQEILDMYANAGAVGTVIAISSPEGEWVKAQGFQNFEEGIALDGADLSRIGSITKVYIATTILKLYEDGKLDLDANISDYLPDDVTSNIANGDTLTVRQLLNHTSGLVNYVMKTYQTWDNDDMVSLPADENIAFIYGDPADFTPGEGFNYSNSNYLLLGMIIKNASGESSAYAAITKLILAPNGLTNTVAEAGTEPPVQGYMLGEDGTPANGTHSATNAVGGQDLTDGGISANALDVLRFFQLLATGEILKPETLAEMQTWEAPEFHGTEGMVSMTGYGLGLMQISTHGTTAFGHFGSVSSYNSLAYYFPEIETTIVVLNSTNSAGITGVHMGDEIYGKLFD